MNIISLAIPDIKLIKLDVFHDNRGAFTVHWHDEKFQDAVDGYLFRQDSFVTSKKNVVRGLHYQLPPYDQGKLVRCLQGAIQDVVVDIRKTSPTFGKWIDVILSAENNQALWIPPGFAHGYAALSDSNHVFYKCTDLHAPSHERSLLWNDPDLKISWNVDKNPLVSEKDIKGIPFSEADLFE